MLLGRLRVRQKLVLLVLPLLLIAIAGAVPLVAGRVLAAEHSGDAAGVVERATRITELVQELQQERLASLGFLTGDVDRDRVVTRTARVHELTSQLTRDYADGDEELAIVLRGIDSTAGLGGLRDRVLSKQAPGIEVFDDFSQATNGLIDVLRLTEDADLLTEAGRQQVALDSIIRHDEATAAEGSALFIEPGRRITARVIGLVSRGLALEDREEDTFKELAQPSAVALYEQVEDGQSSTRLNNYLGGLVGSASSTIDVTVAADLLPQVESLTSLSRLVETQVSNQAVTEAQKSARTDRWLAGIGIGVALLLLTGATVLSVLITRSIARPLRRLTASADEVADVAQQELVRVADSDDPEAAVPQLRPVQVGTADELGELAQAFNRVQQVATSLVERQLVSRQNVATMFGNVGRRTQNLVGRQLAMIDSLERNEQDPALLDRLYRLDHVSTRLRRNANSLVVLSGATDQQITGEPLTVADTIRSALGEIEGFQRVRLGEVDGALLTPNVTPDVILLLAELLENGTSFSPPHTEVEVDAQSVAGDGVVIRIVDHGLGMTTDQLAAENGRLVSRERLDLAPTDVLGLFVVGRLARRHGIEVLLAPTPGTGVTAEVRVPAGHVVRSDPPAEAEPAPVPAPAPASAPGGGEDGRGWWDSVEGSADWAQGAAGGAVLPPLPVRNRSAVPAPADARRRADAARISNGAAPVTEPAPAVGTPGAGVPVVEAPGAGASVQDVPVQDVPVQDVTVEEAPAANGIAANAVVANGVARAAEVADPVPAEAATHGVAAADIASVEVAENDAPAEVAPNGASGRAAADGASAEGTTNGAAAGPEANGVAAEVAPNGASAEVEANGAVAGVEADGASAEAEANGVAAEAGAGKPALVPARARSFSPRPTASVAAELAARQASPFREAPAASGSVAGPEPVRPRGATGMVRRVRGAQHPDTGAAGRTEPEEAAPAPSADDARREIEDFEGGVQRARRETGADGGDGFLVDAEAAGLAPWTTIDPDDPESAQQTRALVEEFETGVRQALARFDEVAAKAPDPAPLFERPAPAAPDPAPLAERPAAEAPDPGPLVERPAAEAPDPGPLVERPAAKAPDPGPLFEQPAPAVPDPAPLERPAAMASDPGPFFERPASAVPGPRRSEDPPAVELQQSRDEGVPLVPRRIDAGVARPDPPRGRPDPRPLERRRPLATPAPPSETTSPGLGQEQPAAAVTPPTAPERSPSGERGPDSAGDRINEPSPNGSVEAAPEAGKLDATGDGGLVRRVPGAQMPAGARAARPGVPDPAAVDVTELDGTELVPAEPGAAERDAAEQAAAAARSLVDEFEAGVQRALQVGDDHTTAGTAETDEEDAR